MKQSIEKGTQVTVGTEITLTINTPGPLIRPRRQALLRQKLLASTTSTASAASQEVWSTDSKLGAPSNYTGGAYRLVLEQTVDGERRIRLYRR